MRVLIACVVAVTIAGTALAHEKFKFVGTVAAVQKDEIAIKAIDGAVYEMDYSDATAVTDKNHRKIDRALLKAGEKVVVIALGHDMFDLEAVEVQLTDR
jgi:hypothetical protein